MRRMALPPMQILVFCMRQDTVITLHEMLQMSRVFFLKVVGINAANDNCMGCVRTLLKSWLGGNRTGWNADVEATINR